MQGCVFNFFCISWPKRTEVETKAVNLTRCCSQLHRPVEQTLNRGDCRASLGVGCRTGTERTFFSGSHDDNLALKCRIYSQIHARIMGSESQGKAGRDDFSLPRVSEIGVNSSEHARSELHLAKHNSPWTNRDLLWWTSCPRPPIFFFFSFFLS